MKMTKDEIIRNIQNCGNGRMIRICYRTELPVKAESKKNGVKIFKEVTETVRIGVEYSHIRSATEKQRESITRTARANNFSWIIGNKILWNSNTQKNYVRVATMSKGSNHKSAYLICTADGNKWEDTLPTEFAKQVQSSYWRESSPTVKNISLENIVYIGKKVTE